jgi:hypothetical protein
VRLVASANAELLSSGQQVRSGARVPAQRASERHIAHRVRRLMPRTQTLACFWMLGDDPDKLVALLKAI